MPSLQRDLTVLLKNRNCASSYLGIKFESLPNSPWSIVTTILTHLKICKNCGTDPRGTEILLTIESTTIFLRCKSFSFSPLPSTPSWNYTYSLSSITVWEWVIGERKCSTWLSGLMCKVGCLQSPINLLLAFLISFQLVGQARPRSLFQPRAPPFHLFKADAYIEGTQPGARFGSSIGTLGDVDNDGFNGETFWTKRKIKKGLGGTEKLV